MPPYRAQLGGMFGSGVQPRGGGNIDIGGAINAIGNQASSLIQSAYLRKIAERERQKEDAALAQARADRQAQMAIDAQRRAEDVQFRTQEFEFRKTQAEREAELKRQELASRVPRIVDGA